MRYVIHAVIAVAILCGGYEGISRAAAPVAVPVTMRTFREAFKENGVMCEPTELRLIGRETVGKRYVVDIQCPDKQDGLVAFIPLEGNTKKFETLDCSAAIERHVVCALEPK
jgi:hypothetical protein